MNSVRVGRGGNREPNQKDINMDVRESEIWQCVFRDLDIVNGGVGKYCAYFSPESIKPIKGILGGTAGVRMLTLEDYEHPQKSNLHGEGIHMSYVSYLEFHIKEPKRMMLHISFHSGNMGEGSIVFSADVDRKWFPINADTVDYYLWDSVRRMYKGK